MAIALWHNAPRHDGLVICGSPITYANWLEEAGDNGDFPIPIGNDAFVTHFLEGYFHKVQQLAGHINDLPNLCSPGRPGIQSANLLLRFCCAQKCTHFLRMLPPPLTQQFAAQVDSLRVAAFEELNETPLTPIQREAVQLPMAHGGAGLKPIASITGAAYVGAWFQVMPQVARITNLDPRSPSHTAVYGPLYDAIIELDTRFGVNPFVTLETSWSDVVRTGIDKAQRRLSAPIAAHLMGRASHPATHTASHGARLFQRRRRQIHQTCSRYLRLAPCPTHRQHGHA